jgi:predicted Fe-S protein YdhL (DUF1289 family)
MLERERPASPCIQVCELSPQGICRGCYRSRDEITLWARLDAAGQWAVLENCRQREKLCGQSELNRLNRKPG